MSLNDLLSRWLFWLTDAERNLRSMAVLRILYGLGLLMTFIPSIPDRLFLWGNGSFWVDPESKRRGYFTFDVFLPKDNAVVFDIVFFGMILLTFLFMVGFGTRIITPVLLLLVVSWQSNNMFLTNGGDTIYRITLLFLVFANLSAYYSVDAWMRKRRSGTSAPAKRILPAYVGNALHNTALILCCFQIIVVYVVSGIWKLTGEDWPGGTALFYALRIDAFMAYPAINELVWQSSLVIYIATFVALWVQTLFPLALLWRPTRIFVLVSLIFMHLGIAVFLGLWPFSLAMIALDMLYIRDSTWVSMESWARSTKLWAWGEQQYVRLRENVARPKRTATPASDAPDASAPSRGDADQAEATTSA